MLLQPQDVVFVDGFSESLWVSLAVKAVRIGWPAGLVEAQKRLGKTRVKDVLVTQVFEDIYPESDSDADSGYDEKLVDKLGLKDEIIRIIDALPKSI